MLVTKCRIYWLTSNKAKIYHVLALPAVVFATLMS